MNDRSKPYHSKSRAEPILFLACVAIVLAPLALRGTSCGQDFDFHLQSWMEAARAWHSGLLYPHWLASANYGAGEPRFVFYPPLSWAFGAFLGVILPWTWTPVAFTTICLLAVGAACYKTAREWMPSYSSALAACLYVINPYVFFVIYERSACGELLAAAWLPLLVLYALREKPATPQLALTIALLWLTNAPAAVMGSYALAIIVIVAAISQRRWTLVIRAASGTALGLGLAAVYLIPAIYEQRWVEIARAIGPGMRIQDSFLFGHTGMVYHDQVLRTASWITAALLVATVIAAALSYRVRKPQSLRNPLIALAAVIAFLQFPISKFVWNVAPELRFLQFPWRWMLVLGFVFAVFAAVALKLLSAERKTLNALFVLVLATLCATHAWRHFWLVCDDEDNIRAQITTLHQQGFEGTDEYTPRPADNGDIQQNLPPIRVVSTPDGDQADSSIEENPDYQPNRDDLLPATIHIVRWQSEHISATIQSPQSGYAVLRLMDYPAWKIRVNNKPAQRQARDDGLLAVPIPSGTTTIDVDYATTPDAWAGRAVSAVALILWLALAAKTRRQRV
jgi:uncharacterized membrane protein